MNEEFAENGVSYESLTEYQAKPHTRDLSIELCASFLLSMIGHFAVGTWFSVTLPEDVLFPVVGMVLVSFMVSLIGCAIGFAKIAESAGKLPSKANGFEPEAHITGMGAGIGILLLLFIFVAAVAGEKLAQNFIIPEWVGHAVILGICVAFTCIFLFSRFVASLLSSTPVKFARHVLSPLDPLGRGLSLIDRWLVFVVAPMTGTTLKDVRLRYFFLFGEISASVAFAWFGPAPFGLLGTGLSLVLVISVNRRWSWIETERSRRIDSRSSAAGIREISIAQDLRDEAIFAILALMIILPVGMRQFDLAIPAVSLFSVDAGAMNRIDAWTGFFGVEMLKALPFLDWADIYGARGNTRISILASGSMHLLLVARAIVDLVFLSAIIQAISISVSLSRNRSRFLLGDPSVDRLDDRIERHELLRLIHGQDDEYSYHDDIQKFLRYNSKRLSLLRSKYREDPKMVTLISEIFVRSGKQIDPPIDQLVEVSAKKNVDKRELTAVITEVKAHEDFDLDKLMIARRQLNWTSGIDAERQALVQLIVTKCALGEARESELANILLGSDSDSLATVRVLVLRSLAKNASLFPRNVEALHIAGQEDKANAVRKAVRSAMKQHGLSVPTVAQDDLKSDGLVSV